MHVLYRDDLAHYSCSVELDTLIIYYPYLNIYYLYPYHMCPYHILSLLLSSTTSPLPFSSTISSLPLSSNISALILHYLYPYHTLSVRLSYSSVTLIIYYLYPYHLLRLPLSYNSVTLIIYYVYPYHRTVVNALLIEKLYGDLLYLFLATGVLEENRVERETTCLKQMKTFFPDGLSALYVRGLDLGESGEKHSVTNQIIEDIREVFIDTLSTETWLDDATKNMAMRKASTMAKKIGHPELLHSDNFVQHIYDGYEPNVFDYYSNVVNMYQFIRRRYFNRYADAYDKSKWQLAVLSSFRVNAAYVPIDNNLVVLQAILNEPAFQKNGPKYLNYGGLGFIIGHEITHGFDDTGGQFDENGNKQNWWSPSSMSNFKQKAECFKQQYGNFRVTNGFRVFEVNGTQTLCENIADNGGIKAAYRAYKKWQGRHGDEPSLAGLPLNQDQMFFVGSAQFFCGNISRRSLLRFLLSSVYPPYQERVNGFLMNSDDFSATFQCPAGSPMNPVFKCNMW